MKRFKSQIIGAVALSVLAFIGTIMNSHQAAAQGPPGGLAVNVVQSIPLQANVSGNVGITGTPNVNVTNPATAPVLTRDEDNPARRAFQAVLSESNSSFTVPLDQRLTIETASADCEEDPPAPALPNFETSIFTSVGGQAGRQNILTLFHATGTGSTAGIQFYVGGATIVRIYADPGTTVSAFTGATGSHCTVNISGYMIPK